MSRGACIPRSEPDVHLVPCNRPVGGDKTVKPPGYRLVVVNPPVEEAVACLWRDDDGTLITEDNGEYICIDNA